MIIKARQLLVGAAAGATATALLTGLAPGTTPTAEAAGSVTVIRTLATRQNVPWGLARLPGGTNVLYTDRDTHMIKQLNLKTGKHITLGKISAARSDPGDGGEGGLLGIAVDPHYDSNHLLYVYYSTATDNRVARVKVHKGKPGHRLDTPKVILKGIPHNVHHNGGQLMFGPAGELLVTTGDAENTSLPQNKRSLGGKILRITTSGKPAPGDPIKGSPVWTWGHRNVQGLATDPTGRLWASEFGDRKADELNLIMKGHDYGWPATQGKTSHKGYTSPVVQWGTEVDSPSGIAYARGSIWMAALKGERLYRIPIHGSRAAGKPTAFLVGKYGRLRSVLALGSGKLLVTTSNTDGRTSPGRNDDRILELSVR